MLFEHYAEGYTLYEEIRYSKYASKIEIDTCVKFSKYWDSSQLLKMSRFKRSFAELANDFCEIIDGYEQYLGSNQSVLTLTGGNDSRLILASLMNLGIKPNVMMYGNPESYDGYIVKLIVEKLDLEFKNFYNTKMEKHFPLLAEQIIQIGDSMINIHRAHRLDAFQRVIQENSSQTNLLVGNMGGEYIKGVMYDDYITSRLYREWSFSKAQNIQKIKDVLKRNYFVLSDDATAELCDEISSYEFLKMRGKNKEHSHQYDFVGAVHHT